MPRGHNVRMVEKEATVRVVPASGSRLRLKTYIPMWHKNVHSARCLPVRVCKNCALETSRAAEADEYLPPHPGRIPDFRHPQPDKQPQRGSCPPRASVSICAAG